MNPITRRKFVGPHFCLTLLVLVMLGFSRVAGWGDPAPLWQDDLTVSGLDGWSISPFGGADADAEIDFSRAVNGAPSLKFESRSPLALGVYLGASSKKTFPITGGELILHLQAAGKNAGQAFVSLVFHPGESESSRLNLPTGTFDWKTLDFPIDVPSEATRATVFIGIKSKTSALWINDLTVTPSAKQRSSLTANWLPRPHERIFPQAGAPAGTLLALDVSRLDADTAMFVTTLQGLVNRK
jgi:hypothetical protein